MLSIKVPLLNISNYLKSVRLSSQRLFSVTTTNEQQPTKIEKTINNVTLLGRVGADPEKKGSSEHPVVIFSLATHSNYRYETGEFVQRTDWHRIVCFKPGLRDSIATYLKKGQRVHVTGRILYGEVKGENGSTKSTTSIAADDVIFFQ
ncbi:mitochondrial single stranded DNA-binding protein [Rhynchophorus ferrugineus]|uniref:mitochondrial single stranded DNA-binding protein n=1 Tax=Rhynchophorus ferrugineus TaxID=354439 RepID=UPI003FCCD01E